MKDQSFANSSVISAMSEVEIAKEENCYSHEEWGMYGNNIMTSNIRQSMEEHLYCCDKCMEKYLQVINFNLEEEDVCTDDNEYLKEVNPLWELKEHNLLDYDIPINFTEKVMSQIQILEEKDKEKNIKNLKKKELKNYKNIMNNSFICYVIAASITIFFMMSGVFDNMIYRMNMNSQGVEVVAEKISKKNEQMNKEKYEKRMNDILEGKENAN